MARCEITGKGPIVKNLISHSHIATKKWVKPNVHRRRLYSDVLGTFVTLNVCTRAIRTVEHVGGFDKFILRQSTEVLSKRARAVQRRIRRKIAG